jgi:hypothetical protein
VVLATGSRTFRRRGSGAIRVNLTARGRTVLRSSRRIAATLVLSFRPRGGRAISRSAVVRVR